MYIPSIDINFIIHNAKTETDFTDAVNNFRFIIVPKNNNKLIYFQENRAIADENLIYLGFIRDDKFYMKNFITPPFILKGEYFTEGVLYLKVIQNLKDLIEKKKKNINTCEPNPDEVKDSIIRMAIKESIGKYNLDYYPYSAVDNYLDRAAKIFPGWKDSLDNYIHDNIKYLHNQITNDTVDLESIVNNIPIDALVERKFYDEYYKTQKEILNNKYSSIITCINKFNTLRQGTDIELKIKRKHNSIHTTTNTNTRILYNCDWQNRNNDINLNEFTFAYIPSRDSGTIYLSFDSIKEMAYYTNTPSAEKECIYAI